LFLNSPPSPQNQGHQGPERRRQRLVYMDDREIRLHGGHPMDALQHGGSLTLQEERQDSMQKDGVWTLTLQTRSQAMQYVWPDNLYQEKRTEIVLQEMQGVQKNENLKSTEQPFPSFTRLSFLIHLGQGRWIPPLFLQEYVHYKYRLATVHQVMTATEQTFR
jgi:hypothetical protein